MLLSTTRIVTATVVENGLVGLARSVDTVSWAISEVAVGVVVSISKARRALASRRGRPSRVPELRLVEGGKAGVDRARRRSAARAQAPLRAIGGGRGAVLRLHPHNTPHVPVSGAVGSGAGVPS